MIAEKDIKEQDLPLVGTTSRKTLVKRSLRG